VVLALDRLGGSGLAMVDVGLVVLEHALSVGVRTSDGTLSVEEIDLLERKSLGLGDAEVGEQEASNTSRSPNEEDLDTKVGGFGSVDTVRRRVNEVRSSVSDTEVPEPVRGSGHRHSLGSDSQGEDLSGNDPSDGSPSGSKGGNVNANEGDEDPLSSQVDGSVGDVSSGSSSDTDNSNDELADGHNNGSGQKHVSSTGSIDHEDTGDSTDDIDNVGDDGNDEGVGDTRSLEEGGTVVEDEVDTGKLLPSLKEDSSPSSETVSSLSTSEAVNVRGLAKSELSLEGHGDVEALLVNFSRVGGSGCQSRESLSSLEVSALQEKVSRRLRKEEHATSKDRGPSELDGNGDSPGRVVVSVLSRLVDDSGEEETDGDGPLVKTDDGSSERFGRAFGLVKRDKTRNTSDTETGNDSTSNEDTPNGGELHAETGAKDDAGCDQTKSSTKQVTDGVGSKSTEESARR